MKRTVMGAIACALGLVACDDSTSGGDRVATIPSIYDDASGSVSTDSAAVAVDDAFVSSSGGSSGAGASSGSGSGGGSGSLGGSGSGACSPLSSVPPSEIPAYTPVVQRLHACSSAEISSFIGACLGITTTQSACDAFQRNSANATCLSCLFPSTPSAGAVLEDYTGKGILGSNTPGCIALADRINGPACAAVLEPWLECTLQACASAACTASASANSACQMAADSPGAACYSRLSASHNAACQVDLATGGVFNTRCSTDAQVLNAICGTGP